MVIRRVAVLGALALVVLSGSACKPDLDGRPSLVTGPRVLAVRSDPAEVAPGAQVTYLALFTGPDPGVLSWALCGDRKPLTELGPVSPKCLVPDGSALTQLGNGESATAEIPKEVCRSFGPDTPAPLPGEPAGRPTDPDGTGGYYQPVRVALPDGTYATAETRLSCGVSGATQEQLAELTARGRPNTNPELSAVTADGVAAADGGFDAKAGARVALRAGWAACPTSPTCGDGVCSDDELVAGCPEDCTDKKGCTGAERYVLFDPTARAVATRREAMRVSWFAEAGEWDADRTGRDETDSTSASDNVWTAPAAPGDVRLWIVLRDDRGGVGYRALVAHVRLSGLPASPGDPTDGRSGARGSKESAPPERESGVFARARFGFMSSPPTSRGTHVRTVLFSLGFVGLLGSFAACGGSDSDTESAASMIAARPDETAAKASRGACTFTRGAMPRDTLGAAVPVGTDIPIDTVVVLMLENHSFDNYFARLGKYAGRTDIEGAPEDASNPDKAGAKHPFEHAPRLCTLDVNHEWKGTHDSWADGRMDGFFQANDGWDASKLPAGADPTLASGSRSMIYYDERDIPFYYKLASTFAIADHYHSSLLGPTWPNRMYLLSATSFGKASNTFPELSAFKYPDNPASILDSLEKAKVSWNLYTDGLPGAGVVHAADILKRWDRKVNYDTATFLSEAAAGKLPNVSFLDPHIGAEGPDQNDEHPPADVQVGEKFVSDIVHALMASPQWPRMALFITWDEHGGYYDHLPPPKACPPDGLAPELEAGDPPGGFDRYGIRVPLILVSPYAKPGYAGHTTYDHTSITRFIEARFDLPALSGRDANAEPLLDLFDFQTPAFKTPPTLPDAKVDPDQLAWCKATFGKK